MPNVIKYSTTIQPNTIKKGNLLLGVNNIGYGPSNVTGYWAGINPPTSGYTIYRVATETSGYTINTCETDNDVIYWASVFGNTGGDNINQALLYLTTGSSNTAIVNKNYESIVTSGLVLNLDATFVPSYPKSGTLWYDISGNVNNGTLTNGPSYSSLSGGSIVFDGVDDYVSGNGGLINDSNFSVSFWIKYQDTLVSSRGIVSSWDTSWNGFGIASSPTGYIRSWTNNGAGGGMNWDLTSTIKDVWSNLTLTYTFSSKTQSGYINGVFKTSETFGTSITHSTLQIGRGGQTGSIQLVSYPYTNCLISNLQIYNRALTLSEIQQNYESFGKSFVSFDIQYLVIAGGGGPGMGGGGAGGYIESTTNSIFTQTIYSIIVGAGGPGFSSGASGIGTKGSDSVLFDVTATGGGFGGAGGASTTNGGNGGSGGGGGGYAGGVGGIGNTPSKNPSQGNNGGNGNNVVGAGGGWLAGGGGGAGGNGGSFIGTTSGNGGVGTASSITGVSVSRAGGGAGGGNGLSRGTASSGGGNANTNGTINTGGGGGGRDWGSPGGNGGSGIIIIKIPNVYTATFSNGVSFTTSTSVSGYKIYSVTATSTTSETVTFS